MIGMVMTVAKLKHNHDKLHPKVNLEKTAFPAVPDLFVSLSFLCSPKGRYTGIQEPHIFHK